MSNVEPDAEKHQTEAASKANTKQEGKCPFCLKSVVPAVVESNTLRRDQCECPECHERIFLCRSPGCHDFAKGTSVYDHELCSECTGTVSNTAGVVAKAALQVFVLAAGAFVTEAIANGKK